MLSMPAQKTRNHKSLRLLSTHCVLQTILRAIHGLTCLILIIIWIFSFIPTLQVRKLRHRVVSQLAQGHTASKWQVGFKTRQSGSRVHVPTYYTVQYYIV